MTFGTRGRSREGFVALRPLSTFAPPGGYFHPPPLGSALYTSSVIGGDVASAANVTLVNDMITFEDTSWQDVYASYGCSLSMDASDDDG